MSLVTVRALLLVAAVSLLTCGVRAIGQEQITPSNYPCEKYKGELAVFGRLSTTNPGIQLDQAQVKLRRNGGDTLIVLADKEGRYCIRYPSGLDIARLSFEDGDITCVDEISGSLSHYINKVLDNNCAQFHASLTALGPDTIRTIFTAAVEKKFWTMQVALSNTSGGTLQIVSFQFEHDTSKQGQPESASDVIVPVEPDMVELVAAKQRSSVCLLCIGPVTLFQIPFHAHASDAETFIRSHALRVNDIIADGQAEMKLIFIDKSILRADQRQPGGLGNLVIHANKLTTTSDSMLSTTVSPEISVGSAHPGSDGGLEGMITAVASVR